MMYKSLIVLVVLLLSSCSSYVRVSGVIVGSDGAPLKGIRVSTDCGKSVKRTSASGAFNFKLDCPGDSATVRIFGSRIVTDVVKIRVNSNPTVVPVKEAEPNP